jgi:hypothetical protein
MHTFGFGFPCDFVEPGVKNMRTAAYAKEHGKYSFEINHHCNEQALIVVLLLGGTGEGI